MMTGSLGLTLCICLCFWRAHCQILQAPADLEAYPDLTIYPLPANFGGVFTYPTDVTQVYDEGVPMTIAWNTTYEHISLYIAYVHNISLEAPVDGSGNSQRQLQTNTPSNSSDTFSWVASCDPDCNSPYELHIVNSHGTAQEVTQEGFWSDYFWIRASSRPKTDTSTATSATSTTTSSSATSSTASTTSTQEPSTTATSGAVSPSPSAAETGSNELSTGVKVGIGIGAVAIALCTIGLGVLCCIMKKRGEKGLPDTMSHAPLGGDKAGSPTYFAMTPQNQDAVTSQYTYSQLAGGQKVLALDTIQPMNPSPTELAATQSPSELSTAHWR